MKKSQPGGIAPRFLLFLVFFFTLPGIGHAWYVSAKANVNDGPGSIYPSGNLYVSGTTGTSKTVSVSSGHVVRATLDNLPVSPDPGGTSYTIPYNGKSWRYLVVSFGVPPVVTYDISLTVGVGGSVREVNNNSLTDVPAGSNRTLLVSPNYGYQVDVVTAPNASISDNGDGTRTVTYSNLQGDQSVSATFKVTPSVIAHAGPDVTTQGDGELPVGERSVFDGRQSSSNLGAITYAWSGPADLHFATPSAATTTVWSETPGTFTATLTITSGGITKTDTAQVTVPTRAAFLEGLCTSCHATRHPHVISAYDQSGHKETTYALTVSCQTCHDPGGNRHYSIARPVSVCQPCHVDVSSGRHGADATLANQCASCHNPHSGEATGADFRFHSDGAFGGNAQYVSHGARCSDCHANNQFAAYAELMDDFAASGHADVTSPAWASNTSHDWPTLANCRRCHTRVGFVAHVEGTTPATYDDQPGQILACNACHTDVGAITSTDKKVRPVGAVSPGFKSGLPPKVTSYPDAKSSNLCVSCHAGRTGGTNIAESTEDFSNLSFKNSHYLAAGETLFHAAYEYAGVNYAYSGYIHNFAGNNNGGPCVHCHLTAPDSHLFEPLAKDEAGAITSITSTTCDDCHHGYLTPAVMNTRVAGFHAALEALQAQLAARGFFFGEAHPYFYTAPYVPGGANTALKDWTRSGTLDGKNAMGAAFNFNLLKHEPGAWAHNQRYARRLIFDSMDFLLDGAINGVVNIDALVGPEFTQAQADRAKAYLDSNTVFTGVQRP